jgi:hypothetical protein
MAGVAKPGRGLCRGAGAPRHLSPRALNQRNFRQTWADLRTGNEALR